MRDVMANSHDPSTMDAETYEALRDQGVSKD
jgi:hypothetical protein